MNKKTAWVVIVLFFAILIGLLVVSYIVSNLGPREVKIAAKRMEIPPILNFFISLIFLNID